jgi:hypothetical protein
MAVGMSAAIVMSMSVATVFAASGDSSGSTQTSPTDGLTFSKIYENENGGIVPNATFTFTMTPCEVPENLTNSEGVLIKKGVELGKGNDTVTMTFNALTDNEQEATFSFEDVDFNTGEPAVYRYIVDEVEPDGYNKEESDLEYDTSQFTVDVSVDNEGNVISIINVTDSDSSDTVTKKPIVFHNIYKADDLVIRKVVSGSLANNKEKFGFELYIPAPGDHLDLKEGSTIEAYIVDTATGSITATDDITVGTKYPFELSDGQELLVDNVPEGMIYTVEETNAKGYKTNIKSTMINKTEQNDEPLYNTTFYDKILYNTTYYDARKEGQDTPIIDGENLIVFENIKDYKTDTGIRIDVVPYIVVFAIAIAGVSVLIIRRRRKGTE